MSQLNLAAEHDKWEAVILSPQFATTLDFFFTDHNDFQTTVLVNQVRTSDLIAANIPLLSQVAPTTIPNLIYIHHHLKTLAFSLMDHDKMNTACKFAFSTFDGTPELDIESPKLKFIRLNYGTTSAPHLARIVSETATPPPRTPSPQLVNQCVTTSPIIQPMMSSKSLSPIPYLQKGNYCAESPDSPSTSHFSISLPPTHAFEDLKINPVETTKVEDVNNSPTLSTPNNDFSLIHRCLTHLLKTLCVASAT